MPQTYVKLIVLYSNAPKEPNALQSGAEAEEPGRPNMPCRSSAEASKSLKTSPLRVPCTQPWGSKYISNQYLLWGLKYQDKDYMGPTLGYLQAQCNRGYGTTAHSEVESLGSSLLYQDPVSMQDCCHGRCSDPSHDLHQGQLQVGIRKGPVS